MYTEDFPNTHDSRKTAIINAALVIFGKNGYKKTSISDIAEAAGVSKSSLFYYFGSKAKLYEHLADLCIASLTKAIDMGLGEEVNDFFDRIKQAAEIKMAVARKNPAMLSFLAGFYFETAPEVSECTKRLCAVSMQNAAVHVFDKSDLSRFKDGVDPAILYKMILMISEGFATTLTADVSIDEIDGFINDFYVFLDMMKRYLCE